MSDHDTTVTAEETTAKVSRLKNALKKVAPFAPIITTAEVVREELRKYLEARQIGVDCVQAYLTTLEETYTEDVEIIESPVKTTED